MATSATQKLREYAEALLVSDKRRYLENTKDIGDRNCYESSSFKADVLPSVKNTEILN